VKEREKNGWGLGQMPHIVQPSLGGKGGGETVQPQGKVTNSCAFRGSALHLSNREEGRGGERSAVREGRGGERRCIMVRYFFSFEKEKDQDG